MNEQTKEILELSHLFAGQPYEAPAVEIVSIPADELGSFICVSVNELGQNNSGTNEQGHEDNNWEESTGSWFDDSNTGGIEWDLDI